MKPLIKWAGGKAKFLDLIETELGPGKHYIEPFAGGAAVLLNRLENGSIQTGLLADINPKIVTLYQVVQQNPEDLLAELKTLPTAEDNWTESYYEYREEFNACNHTHPIRLTALFIWLNKTCFNGLYRENKKGEFNVPVGKYKTFYIPDETHIMDVSKLLQKVDVVCLPFQETMCGAKTGDQIYCDPPYIPLSPTGFTKYAKNDFSYADHLQLAKVAASSSADVLISNHLVNSVYEAYSPEIFTYKKIPNIQRSISASKSGRTKVSEVFIKNYD